MMQTEKGKGGLFGGGGGGAPGAAARINLALASSWGFEQESRKEDGEFAHWSEAHSITHMGEKQSDHRRSFQRGDSIWIEKRFGGTP